MKVGSNLQQWVKVLAVSGSIVLLAACSAHKKTDQSTIDNANAAYSSDQAQDAQTTGAGDQQGFNDSDSASSRAKRMAKNVYYFDFDSNVVHDADKAAIDANGNYLAAHPKAKIMLEGHTDPRGSREYNIGLGERRAKAIAAILTAEGVNPSQVRVVSYGAEKLASADHSDSAYQLDRRVVLVYLQR